jgi:hypothetical protein
LSFFIASIDGQIKASPSRLKFVIMTFIMFRNVEIKGSCKGVIQFGNRKMHFQLETLKFQITFLVFDKAVVSCPKETTP